MTKSEYIEAGYRLSLQVEQTQIDRAESEVIAAYCARIAPTMSVSDEAYKSAVMTLAFLWLLQHSAFATRAGAKTTRITSAAVSPDYEVMRQSAMDCHAALMALRSAAGDTGAEVLDICRVYMVTNFFGV